MDNSNNPAPLESKYEQFRQWLIETNEEDQWWLCLDGVVEQSPLSLSGIEERIETGLHTRAQLLHLSQANTENRVWNEISLHPVRPIPFAIPTPLPPPQSPVSPKTAESQFKKPLTVKQVVLYSAIAGLTLVFLSLKSGGFFGGSPTIDSRANVSEQKRAFAMTAEEFRTAFNKWVPRALQIDAFKNETIDGEPWVSYVFADGSGIKINLEPETEQVCTLMCTFTKHPPRNSGDSYTLANAVVYVLSPEANSGETWYLVDRLTREADGSNDVKSKGELFRNISLSMLSSGKSDSGLPLLMLVFTPRPASNPEPAPKIKVIDTLPDDGSHESGDRFAKRGGDGIKRNGYYRITSLYPMPWKRITWKYEILRDGGLYFLDRTSNRLMTVSHPYTVEEEYAGEGQEPNDEK